MSCEFQTEKCKKCSSFTMCSLLNTEQHITEIENKLLNIFSSLNNLLEFSSKTGMTILEIKESIPDKNDIIDQFNIVFENFEDLKKLVIYQNEEIKNILLNYSSEVKNLSLKILEIEKVVGLDRKTN